VCLRDAEAADDDHESEHHYESPDVGWAAAEEWQKTPLDKRSVSNRPRKKERVQ
jgi:hypothetical protein